METQPQTDVASFQSEDAERVRQSFFRALGKVRQRFGKSSGQRKFRHLPASASYNVGHDLRYENKILTCNIFWKEIAFK